ncbi:hypothetical protein AOQ72_10555 [Bradyrhizobium yuanmingense]|uniref:Uncharacterized protein n=1 Tax=Bradyrhizobium yuanmingense TaxID=108015 RepID=A0A0R3CW80_9BRAD|nr:hypothetical protein AOQ72_10555 [Bradyrhizobium yuanmingense]
MNRHARRASVKSIRHSDLITHLIGVEVPLDDHATLHRAVLHWYSNIAARKPVCIACKVSFLDDETRVGAFLLSVPVCVPDIVATSAFCAECHETLSLAEVDAVSTRVLRQLAPGGKFLAAP